jgi:hypothetical protein
MIRVRLSKNLLAQFDTLLEQGYPRFGECVVRDTQARVYQTIEQHLTRFPRRPRQPGHGLCVYSVKTTPFVLLYDFDPDELRIHFIFHGVDDYSGADLNSVELVAADVTEPSA